MFRGIGNGRNTQNYASYRPFLCILHTLNADFCVKSRFYLPNVKYGWVSAGIATEFDMNEAVKVWMEHGPLCGKLMP